MFKHLLKARVTPNQYSQVDKTCALFYSFIQKKEKSFEILIKDENIDLEIKDGNGVTLFGLLGKRDRRKN